MVIAFNARGRGFESRHSMQMGCSSVVERFNTEPHNKTVPSMLVSRWRAAGMFHGPSVQPGVDASLSMRRSPVQVRQGSPDVIAQPGRPAGRAEKGRYFVTGIGPDYVGYRTNLTRIHSGTGADVDNMPDA